MKSVVGSGLLALTIFSSLAYADTTPPPVAMPPATPVTHAPPGLNTNPKLACKLDKTPLDRVSYIFTEPSWFAKVDPNNDFEYFIGNDGNELVSLSEKDESRRYHDLPGSIDPTITHDGRIMITPLGAGAAFFDMTGIKELVVANPTKRLIAKELRPIYTDDKMQGNYQSMGILKTVGNVVTYRLYMASGNDHFRDYTVTYTEQKSADGQRKLIIKPVQPAPVTLCDHVPGLRETPMISKSGLFFSAYVSASANSTAGGSSKIWYIGPEGKNCKEVVDLGQTAGKIEFNYTDTAIAFHRDNYNANFIDIFPSMAQTITKDVYYLELKKKTAADGSPSFEAGDYARLTSNLTLGQGCYYPSWSKDNKITCICNDKNGSYSFQTVNPAYALKQPYTFTAAYKARVQSDAAQDAGAKQAFLANQILGSIWQLHCNRDLTGGLNVGDPLRMTPTITYFSTSAMDPAGCQKLASLVKKPILARLASDLGLNNPAAKAFRDAMVALHLTKEDVINFPLDKLANACPKPVVRTGAAANPLVAGTPIHPVLTGPSLVFMRCAGCHTGGTGAIIPIDFSNLGMIEVNAAIDRLGSPVINNPNTPGAAYHMPQGSPLSSPTVYNGQTYDERKILIDHFSSLKTKAEAKFNNFLGHHNAQGSIDLTPMIRADSYRRPSLRISATDRGGDAFDGGSGE